MTIRCAWRGKKFNRNWLRDYINELLVALFDVSREEDVLSSPMMRGDAMTTNERLRALLIKWGARVDDMERTDDGVSWQGEMREISRCMSELAALLDAPRAPRMEEPDWRARVFSAHCSKHEGIDTPQIYCVTCGEPFAKSVPAGTPQ